MHQLDRRRLHQFVLATIAIISSCTDHQTPPTEPDLMEPGTEPSVVAPPPYVDILSEPRFAIDVSTSGTLRPGASVSIDATVTALVDTKQARIAITAPEVRVAEQLGWVNDFVVPESTPIAPHENWSGSLQAHESITERASLLPARPGYYRIVVTARPPASRLSLTSDGVPIQNFVSEELWLWIDPAGGSVTRAFESELFPAGSLMAPGPLRPRAAPVPRPSEPLQASLMPMMSSFTRLVRSLLGLSRSGSIAYKFLYFNQNTSSYTPVTTAYWQVSFCEYAGRSCDPVGTEDGYTSSEFGTFIFSCSGDEYDGTVYHQNFRVSAPGNSILQGDVGSDCNNASYYQVLSTNDMGAHAFVSMDTDASEAPGAFGYSRSLIPVTLDPNADNSFYSPSGDYIVLKSTQGDDHIWGTWGRFVIGHEYGHAFHEKALAGNEAGGNCPSPHFLDGAHNLQCAYSEGFADYFAAYVADAFTGEIEGNVHYPGCVYDSEDNCTATSTDGAIIEGAVAAFLYDITDPANEGHDDVAYPGSYVADIIRTCEVYVHPVWLRANGVDHLVYCFERDVDSAVTSSGTYFPTRSTDPAVQAESATEPPGWSQAHIRALWVADLYGES